MKKLQLKALKLGPKEILTRAQLKKIMAGSGDDGNKCSTSCVVGSQYKACDAIVVQGATKCQCPGAGNESKECH